VKLNGRFSVKEANDECFFYFPGGGQPPAFDLGEKSGSLKAIRKSITKIKEVNGY
jgi:hypothetical protein